MSLVLARQRARELGQFEDFIALIPYARWIGLRAEIRDGEPRFSLPFQPMLTGNAALPAIHGGVVAGFAESAAQLHLLYRLDETRVPKNIDFSIDYLHSARTVELHAACTVERLGRRVAQVQVRCWQDDVHKPIAIARTHFLLTAPE